MTIEDQKLLTALVEQGTLDRDLLKARRGALETSMREKGMARALLSTFDLSEGIIADTLSRIFALGKMAIAAEIETAPEQLFTEDEIRLFRTLPVFRIGLELTIAFIDPPVKQLLLRLQQLTGYRVIPVFTTVSDFDAALKKYRG